MPVLPPPSLLALPAAEVESCLDMVQHAAIVAGIATTATSQSPLAAAQQGETAATAQQGEAAAQQATAQLLPDRGATLQAVLDQRASILAALGQLQRRMEELFCLPGRGHPRTQSC